MVNWSGALEHTDTGQQIYRHLQAGKTSSLPTLCLEKKKKLQTHYLERTTLARTVASGCCYLTCLTFKSQPKEKEKIKLLGGLFVCVCVSACWLLSHILELFLKRISVPQGGTVVSEIRASPSETFTGWSPLSLTSQTHLPTPRPSATSSLWSSAS